MPATSAPGARRERLRLATLAEIDAASRALLDRDGPAGVTVAAVAREMDMTGPALYRYVDSHADLLTRLITAGYDEVAERLEAASRRGPDDDLSARVVGMALEWRGWALTQPSMFALLYGSPLPGYSAPEDGPTTAAARRVGSAFLSVVAEAEARGHLGEPAVARLDGEAERVLEEAARVKGLPPGLPSRVVQASFTAFALLIGAAGVEVFGHMPPWDAEQARLSYLVKVSAALRLVGLPDPRTGPLASGTGEDPG